MKKKLTIILLSLLIGCGVTGFLVYQNRVFLFENVQMGDPDPIISQKPANFSLSPLFIYQDNFTLEWEESEHCNNYSLYHYHMEITSINESITLLDEGLTNNSYKFYLYPSGVHFFIVVAFNDNGNTSSNCVELWITEDIYLSITPYESDDGNFTLEWTPLNQIDHYELYRGDNPITEINESHIPIHKNLNKTTYNITGYGNGEYHFAILGINTYEKGFNITSNSASGKVLLYPSSFTLNVTYFGNGSVQLNWTESNRAINYSVYLIYNFTNQYKIMEGLTNLSCSFNFLNHSEYNGNYKFFIFASNEYGSKQSNIISLEINDLKEPPSSSGDDDDDTPISPETISVIIIIIVIGSSISVGGILFYLYKKGKLKFPSKKGKIKQKKREASLK